MESRRPTFLRERAMIRTRKRNQSIDQLGLPLRDNPKQMPTPMEFRISGPTLEGIQRSSDDFARAMRYAFAPLEGFLNTQLGVSYR